MPERSALPGPRAALPLLVAALALVPVGVVRALPASDLTAAGLDWLAPALAVMLVIVAAVAALAWLVDGLRHGEAASFLAAAAMATLAGGGVIRALGAGALALPVLGVAALLFAAAIADRVTPPIGRRAGRIAAAALLLGIAELLVVAAVLPSVAEVIASGGAALPLAAGLLALVAAVVALGRPLAPVAAATLVGGAAVGAGAASGIEELIGLCALIGSALLVTGGPRRQRAAFEEDAHRLPELASHMADAVLRFDGHLRLHDWNEPAGELLGLDAASAGAHLEDLLGIPLADLPARDATVTVHGAVGGLEIELERSNGGLTAIIRNLEVGGATEVERLGRELRGTIEELLQARRTIELQRQEIERATSIDRLTGVPSRAAILDRLRVEVAQSRRYRHPIAVVLLDVDRFAEINRLHGTAGGDAVLREIALRVRLRVREADALGRAGSDSFLAILPHTDEGGAATFARALRHRIGLRPVTVGQEQVAVTLSIGVAIMRSGEELDADGLLARADEALASARTPGGDRIALDRLHGLVRIDDRRRPGLPGGAAGDEPIAGS